MEPKIQERLLKLSEVLHYFGQYQDCNMLISISRFLALKGIESQEGLEVQLKIDESKGG